MAYLLMVQSLQYKTYPKLLNSTDFIRSDFVSTKERGVTFVGDYRASAGWLTMVRIVLNLL